MATVRLDEQPESPKRYHACELNVLRSGKGSREGIVVPKERPERYVEETAAEEIPIPVLLSDFESDEPPAEKSGEGRRRRRGRRGGHKSGDSEKAVVSVEKWDVAGSKAEDKKSEKSDAPRNNDSRRHRSHRKSGGSKSAGGKSVDTKPAAAAVVEKPKNADAGQQSTVRKRPRHRGGRRHSGSKSSAAPKSAE